MRVTITGSGTPIVVPGRAGPGVMVETGGFTLQFDAGRGATNRIVEAGVDLARLDAVFITHHHSDHLAGLADLAMSWWLEQPPTGGGTDLTVVVPDGPAAEIVEHVLDVWEDEMRMRMVHTGRPGPARLDARRFQAEREPRAVWSGGRGVVVSAVAVRHEPVVPAVGYRVEGPDGVVVISGDTAACSEVEGIASGADVLVHEAIRPGAIPAGLLSDPEAISAYHADARQVGAIAARAGVGMLVLTHCIPPPAGPEDEQGFVDDVRSGGYGGPVVVANDLDFVEV